LWQPGRIEGELTPEQIIESESDRVDVIYYEAPEVGESGILGNTPIVAVGLLCYPPGPYDVDDYYHVKLTPEGWKIIGGPYGWDPGVPEDAPGSFANKYNRWNWAKYQYYKDNALFRPGMSERAHAALKDMGVWYSQKTLAQIFFAIFKAAVMTEGEWKAIEMDMVKLGMLRKELAIEGGKTTTAIILPAHLQTTFIVFRYRSKDDFWKASG